ncbi:DNA uptake protein ComE [Gillisia sp. Hel1_33_143]|uniref:ComEA family DNA-binding protein n=1 Tax=Gillisia sp. Hel1_33_143 TaxID=1336796 RepID=UPI00087BB6AB|nr:helix-hairpin-helix domain-containing protein [Gillisia sp. Hel1_33_143]SDS28589.1 DNA uptake protein ComE [Gillisia sp. Hel1_33_143]
MKNFRSHFVFNRSQQNGIFLLVVIIVILQTVYYLVDFGDSKVAVEANSQQLIAAQNSIDSLKVEALKRNSPKIYPFNPNYLTDYKGYMLGMSTAEIDRLLAYRKTNRWINTSEEFQSITQVSDSLLHKITPFFKFPDWAKKNNTTYKTNTQPLLKTNVPKRDLNTVSAEELQKVKGIGEVLSERIVKYRTKLGGFVGDIQLKDIYGLSAESRKELLQYYTVQTLPDFKILNINEASVIQLSELPYIDYELAREIVNYKLLHETIHNFEELAKIKGFPSEKIDRIALYLSVD